MRHHIFILVLALLLSVVPSCFYSDSEIYYVEPIPDDPALISLSTNLDSLVNPPVNDSLEVTYRVEVEGGKFYYLYADVAGTTIYESDSSSGTFWVNPLYADSSGIDTLYMELYYSSNTNSFADLLGYEAAVENQGFAIDFNLGGTK